MRITVTQKLPTFGLLSLLIGAGGFGTGYWSYTNQTHPFLWLGVLLCSGFIPTFLYSLWNERVIIQVNKSGIFDRRLGVGLILWRDVTDVQVFLEEGHRYICVQVRNPEQYIGRLTGARRSKKLHSYKLGFKGFNVDVAAMDVNILELRRLIGKYLRRVEEH